MKKERRDEYRKRKTIGIEKMKKEREMNEKKVNIKREKCEKLRNESKKVKIKIRKRTGKKNE